MRWLTGYFHITVLGINSRPDGVCRVLRTGRGWESSETNKLNNARNTQTATVTGRRRRTRKRVRSAPMESIEYADEPGRPSLLGREQRGPTESPYNTSRDDMRNETPRTTAHQQRSSKEGTGRTRRTCSQRPSTHSTMHRNQRRKRTRPLRGA